MCASLASGASVPYSTALTRRIMDLLGASHGQASSKGDGFMSHSRRAAAALAAFVAALVVGVVLPDVARAEPATPVPIRGVLRDAGSRSLLRHLHGTPPRRPRGVAGDFPVHGRQHLLRWPQPRLCSTQLDRRVGGQSFGWLVADPDLLRRPAVLRLREQAPPVRGQRRGGSRRADGTDAAAAARSLGLLPGRALYTDVEHYDRADAPCIAAVRDVRLRVDQGPAHRRYLAGVYVHQDSGLRDLAGNFFSTSLARPDAVWMARWDNVATLSGWPTAATQGGPNGSGPAVPRRSRRDLGRDAAEHRQRHHQRTRCHRREDIPGHQFHTAHGAQRTDDHILNHRPTPGGQHSCRICQARGQKVGTTPVWDRISNGGYVSNYYISTPSRTGFSATIPRCSTPADHHRHRAQPRSGPGTTYTNLNQPFQGGALAYVACQKSGSLVSTTRVWNQLIDGRWVSDYDVSNRSNTTYSALVPRCP